MNKYLIINCNSIHKHFRLHFGNGNGNVYQTDFELKSFIAVHSGLHGTKASVSNEFKLVRDFLAKIWFSMKFLEIVVFGPGPKFFNSLSPYPRLVLKNICFILIYWCLEPGRRRHTTNCSILQLPVMDSSHCWCAKKNLLIFIHPCNPFWRKHTFLYVSTMDVVLII